MISVYDVGLNKYDGLGSCVLTPTKASHRQIAGGSYELTLEHPMDEGGKWQHLQNGAILKAPVPEETIEDAREGMEADIYRTIAEAEMREEPSEPQVINYPIWPSTTAGANPAVGMKTTHMNKNYKCTFWDSTSRQAGEPPTANSWWTQIARYTSGSPVIVKLPAGETLYLVSVGEGWYQVITPYGVQGYIKADKVEFVKHVEPGEITSHVITEQLFRITEVDIDNEANKVTAKAQHVSYDLNGILCEDMEISQASAAMAISRIAQGLMMDYNGAIATNLTDTAGTYTQSIKGRNGGFCLLDPDRGVLPAFGAMLKRDNWDVFIMKKKHTDRGYRIRYGKNAKGINWQRKVQDLVTRVVPVAKNEDGSNLYLPEKWVDSTHISEYPTIRMEWLRVDGQVGKDDGTGTDTVWTLENLYTEMRTKAGERYTVDKVDVPVEEVTVNFEQLGDSDEFAWLKDKEQILLYDTIRAIDERIGLEMDLYVTELEYDAIRRKVTGVKLSNSDNYRERTVTGFNVQDNSITPRKLTDEVKDSFLQTAVGVMPNYANANTWKPNTASSEGYVQKGEGNANKVWATNGSGEPGWREGGGSYNLPLAADGTRGGVQIGYTQSGKNYPVQLDGEKMYVNVPWTDTTDFSSNHLTSYNFNTTQPKSSYVTFDQIDPAGAPTTGWYSGFISSHNNYLASYIINKHRTADWYVGYGEYSDGAAQTPTWYKLLHSGNLNYTTSGKNYKVQPDSNGNLYVNVPWTDHYAWDDITGKPGSFYTLPLAANGTRGGVQVGYSSSGKNYAVQLSNEKMYVNVPWENTTYSRVTVSADGLCPQLINSTQAQFRFLSADGTWRNANRQDDRPSNLTITAYVKQLVNNGSHDGWFASAPGTSVGSPNDNEWSYIEYHATLDIGQGVALFAYKYGSTFHTYRGHMWLNSDDLPLWARFASANEAVSSISRSGTTFTATRADGTTFTFDMPDVAGTYSSQTDPTIVTAGERYKTNWIWDRYRNQLMGLEPSYPYVDSTSLSLSLKRGDFVVVKGNTFSTWNTTNLLVLKSDKAAGATLAASDFESRSAYGDVNYFSYFPVNNVRQRLQNLMGQYQRGAAIYSDGNTHPAITAGEYVFVENHSSLAPGFYCAEGGNIPADGALNSSNVVAVGAKGALNKMQGDISNNVLNVSESSVSKASTVSGGTVDMNRLYKVGNIVFASCRIHSLNNVATNQVFFTIPEGFRPKRAVYASGFASITHNGVTLMGHGLAPYVDTNGQVSVSYSSTATLSQVYFNGCWSVI